MNYESRISYRSHDTTPRQRRIQAQRNAIEAAFNEVVSVALGALILGAGVIALFFFC